MRFVFTVNINIIILRSYKLFSGLNILDRSLPLVVYTPRGGTKKSALKGCLPRTNVRNLIKEGSKIKIDLSDLSAVRDDTKEEF
jgi:hypothetical protein